MSPMCAVVAHQDHLRGVATAMLRHLAEAARRSGIRYFVADVLAENHAMLKVVRDAGWPCEWVSRNAVLHVRIDLADIR